jgi:hypothetical protein
MSYSEYRKNKDRADRRTQCRHMLAEHISMRESLIRYKLPANSPLTESELDLQIDPLQVRLIPSSDDPYTWSYDPEVKHLFEKQISKHTLGAYQELCRWVGTRFKAIPSGATGVTGVSGHLAEVAKMEELEQSYMVLEQSYGVLEQKHGVLEQKHGVLEQRYGVLEQEHSRISEESENRRAQAEESLRLRLSAEDELSDVRGELSSASTVNQDLHQQLEALQSTIKTLEERSANSLRGLDNVIKAVETIRSALRPAVESDVPLDSLFDNWLEFQ